MTTSSSTYIRPSAKGFLSLFWMAGSCVVAGIYADLVANATFVALLLLAGAVTISAKPLYYIYSNLYIVADDYISHRKGIFAIDEVTVPLDRVISTEKKSSILGRMLGYGDILFSSAANNDPDIIFRHVSDPQTLVDEIKALTKSHRLDHKSLKDGV